nr:DUF2752 domain-containing protein [Candidatus Krumholzibacteria bacterium]
MPERSPVARLVALPILLFLIGGLIASRLYPQLVFGLSHCPLRDITGVPCPTCGGTHSAASLAAGRWLDAFLANPVVAVGLVVFGVWAVYCAAATVIPGLRRGLHLTSGEKKAARILAAVLFVGAWVWQIFRVNLI